MSAKHSYDPCRSSLWTASPQPYSGGTLSQSEVSLLTDRRETDRETPAPASTFLTTYHTWFQGQHQWGQPFVPECWW